MTREHGTGHLKGAIITSGDSFAFGSPAQAAQGAQPSAMDLALDAAAPTDERSEDQKVWDYLSEDVEHWHIVGEQPTAFAVIGLAAGKTYPTGQNMTRLQQYFAPAKLTFITVRSMHGEPHSHPGHMEEKSWKLPWGSEEWIEARANEIIQQDVTNRRLDERVEALRKERGLPSHDDLIREKMERVETLNQNFNL